MLSAEFGVVANPRSLSSLEELFVCRMLEVDGEGPHDEAGRKEVVPASSQRCPQKRRWTAFVDTFLQIVVGNRPCGNQPPLCHRRRS